MCYEKLLTHAESHASAVSLLESRESRYIKAINNSNNSEINAFNQFLSQILATLMVQYERSRCVITSPPLFIFWLLKTVFDVLPFYTKIMLKVMCPRLPPQFQGFLLQGFKVLLSFLPLGARKRSYIRTRHSL